MSRTIQKTIWALIFFLGTFGSSIYATHYMGADLVYECLNQCTIRVHVRIYRDCDPAASTFVSANSTTFTPRTTPCALPTPIQAAWSPAVVLEVTPVCPTIATQCSNSSASIRGVEENYFFRDYNICNAGNCIFDVSWADCCRNGAVTSGAANQGIYVATSLNNTLASCNNTPQFTNPPVPYICAGQTFVFNQGAFDADGDSLAYSLGPCNTTGATQQVTYNAGYTATSPLGASWTTSIDPITGDITISPNPTGSLVVGVLCVFVQEYRNGVLLNTIQRDIQVTVITCPNNAVPPIAGVSNTSGLIVNAPTNVTTCAGTPICFNIRATDPNATDVLTMFWDQSLTGATFVNAGNSSIQDTITGVASTQPTGRFCWTPPTPGIYSFVVTIQDDACPIPGRTQYSITINVNGGLTGPTASAALTGSIANCTEVQFSASPGSGGTGPYMYDWTGDGNLNINPTNNQPSMTHIYPGPGTYEYIATVTDAYGCQAVIVDSIVVPVGPVADAGPDITICSGYSTPLGVPTFAGQNYLWQGTTTAATNALSAINIAEPTVTWTLGGSGPDTLDYTLFASSGACTSVDFVRVIVYDIPVASVVPAAPTICDGDTITLLASGGSSYLWNTGDTTASIDVSPNSTMNYSVTVINGGCASPPQNVLVTVNPGPAAIVSGTNFVCPGGSANLTVAGGTNWTWNTGATNQNITVGPIYTDTTLWVVPAVGTCSGQAVNYTVNVHTAPTAAYTTTAVCDGATTSFSDVSTGGSGTISGWSWNFGDPNSGPDNFATTANPTHIYTSPGNFNVTLVVTSSNGCLDTITQAITVNALPVVDYTYADVCIGEDMIFADASGAGVTNWNWTFGDGGSSNVSAPTHTYAQPGAYSVNLTVTDANGCTNTAVKTVFVHPEADVDFTWDNQCFNSITVFSNESSINDPFGTNLGLFTWDFGDGTSSNDRNPVHNYPPGNYRVTLTVRTSKGCESSLSQTVRIEEIIPFVTYDDSVCTGYPAVLWVDQVPPNMDVVWLHSPTSTVPFHVGEIYNTIPLTDNISYWVALRDEDGCISTPQRISGFTFWTPHIDFEVSATEVSIPNAIVEFSIILQNNPSSILWDFGDGTTSTEGNPVHQYTAPGEYTITLTVIDQNGCERVLTKKEYILVTESINLWVPSGFTPNGDGLNDEFFVHTQLITSLDITILNRWGQVIYRSDRLDFRWDGTDGDTRKPAQEGAYTWVIKATTYDGQPYTRSGTITLIR